MFSFKNCFHNIPSYVQLLVVVYHLFVEVFVRMLLVSESDKDRGVKLSEGGLTSSKKFVQKVMHKITRTKLKYSERFQK